MRFRLEHSADQTRVVGIAVIFDQRDVPQLRAMLDLLDRGGVQPAPKPYEPLYRREGIEPEAMYAGKPGSDTPAPPRRPDEENPVREILEQLGVPPGGAA